MARIDERTQGLREEMHGLRSELRRGYVTHAEFSPVRNLVYGLVGVICLSVVGALVALVVRGQGAA